MWFLMHAIHIFKGSCVEPPLKLMIGRVVTPTYSLRWRHNDHAGVSNHRPHGCLLNRLFGRKSKKTLKLRVTGLCAGNSPGTGEFPAQMASHAENVSIWWRHHGMWMELLTCVLISVLACLISVNWQGDWDLSGKTVACNDIPSKRTSSSINFHFRIWFR